MRQLPRTIVIAGVVLGLGALGLFGSSANANPGGCTDGGPPGVIGTDVTPSGSPVYLGAEVFPGPSHYGGGACYIVPGGVAGGIVYTWTTTSQDSTGDRTASTIVRCEYVGGIVTLGCAFDVATDTTDDANWNTNGKATDVHVAGSLGGVHIGSTGAFVGFPGTPFPDLPADGNGTTSAWVDSGTGTCAWANGTPVVCPGAIPIAGITVNEADGVTTTTPGTGCWLGVGSTCAVQNTGVGVARHPAATVQVTTAPPVGTQWVDVPGGGTCIQLGANC